MAAFSRALRDPFVHARNAALLALAATVDLYGEEDCATKILPGICPSLVDKERMVRDQANKTLDLYLQRIRKFAQGLPDIVQPPAGQSTANAPKMANAQTDSSSWAGWAMSSFTNKLASASGQMQAPPNGADASQPTSRASSVPPSSLGAKAPASSSNPLKSPQVSLAPSKSAGANPFASATEQISSAENVDDFDTGWGDDAWGGDAKDDEYDPFAPVASEPASAAPTFDDKGEPDFAGWLTAQKTAKKGPGKPLPKGLAKVTASGRPTIGAKSSSTGTASAASRKAAVVAPRPKPVPKAVEAKKAEDEDEAWGDAWE